MKIFVLTLALFIAGCSPLRHYKFATHPGDPYDTSAGDVTHASEPGARVVVPKKQVSYHLGPEHRECNAAGDCQLVRSWLDDGNKPVLSPLGCVLAHTPVGWMFGDKPSMCEVK